MYQHFTNHIENSAQSFQINNETYTNIQTLDISAKVMKQASVCSFIKCVN